MLLREIDRMKSEIKKPVESTTTPLQPRILKFDASGSPGNYLGGFITMLAWVGTIESTQAVRFTTSRDLGITPWCSSQNPDVGNILNNQFLNTIGIQAMQDVGISPFMAKELKKLKEMILSVPGVVQPIPEVSLPVIGSRGLLLLSVILRSRSAFKLPPWSYMMELGIPKNSCLVQGKDGNHPYPFNFEWSLSMQRLRIHTHRIRREMAIVFLLILLLCFLI
jgi:hypothetical protein